MGVVEGGQHPPAIELLDHRLRAGQSVELLADGHDPPVADGESRVRPAALAQHATTAQQQVRREGVRAHQLTAMVSVTEEPERLSTSATRPRTRSVTTSRIVETAAISGLRPERTEEST